MQSNRFIRTAIVPRAFIVTLVVAAASVISIGAQTKTPAPLAGRWEGVRTAGEEGRTEPVALVFDVKGTTFTGSVFRSGQPFGKISDGKIDGTRLTFLISNITCEATIDGDKMKVSLIFNDGTQEFTVTKKPGVGH